MDSLAWQLAYSFLFLQQLSYHSLLPFWALNYKACHCKVEMKSFIIKLKRHIIQIQKTYFIEYKGWGHNLVTGKRAHFPKFKTVLLRENSQQSKITAIQNYNWLCFPVCSKSFFLNICLWEVKLSCVVHCWKHLADTPPSYLSQFYPLCFT